MTRFPGITHISVKISRCYLQFKQVKLSVHIVHYTPNRYIVPMEFRVHFFHRISAFSRRTKMHLNGMLLIGTEFFKTIVPLKQPPISW